MRKISLLFEQADRFDRVADQCTIPELIPYYRKLAEEWRERAAIAAQAPGENDLPFSEAAE